MITTIGINILGLKEVLLIIALISASGTNSYAVSLADSIPPEETTLKEFVVSSTGSRNIIKINPDGSLDINAKLISDMPSFLGDNDPMAFIKTLPSALTTHELQSGLLVRGSGHGSNLFESNGARVVNPMHMLGFYSAFNPSFYDSFFFSPGYHPPHEANATAGLMKASTRMIPDTALSGIINIGLIESNFSVNLPINKNISSLSLGIRKTYLNFLFSNILKLGESTLNYGFTDINANYDMVLADNNSIRASLFLSRDKMNLCADKNGDVDGSFGWNNLASSIVLNNGTFTTTAAFTLFHNSFFLSEGGYSLNLPSKLLQSTLKEDVCLNSLRLETDLNWRFTSGQCNVALQNPQEASRSNVIEWNVAVSNDLHILDNLDISAGIRAAFYHNNSYNVFAPLPRIRLSFLINNDINLHASYSRHMRFDRLIEESTGGFPADFWINSDKDIKPEDVHSFETGVSGNIPFAGISCYIDVYYKILRNSIEFDGSILELTSPSFRPLEHVITGSGHTYGVSVSAMRQFGNLRGRISYNYGRSKLKFNKYGDSYIPSSFDRPHDLSASVFWSITPSISTSACFTYASGTPYTKAKYGYMIGENLICEYFPRNSSRLPNYSRLDISASWTFIRQGNMKHSLNFSVYNALASNNVLFIYTDYSIDKGIRIRKSIMKNIIPSITYSFNF